MLLLKVSSSIKLIAFLTVALVTSQIATASSSVKGGSSSATSKTSQTSATTSSKQFQVSGAFTATSEPSINYGGSSNAFRESLRIKSKQVLTEAGGGSVPSNYAGGSIYKQTRPSVVVDEALPEVALDASAESTEKQTVNSGEEFQNILGTETTSVQPIFEEEGPGSVSTQAPLATVVNRQKVNKAQQQTEHAVQEIEETELINTNRIASHKAAKRIQAAVRTKHTFEFRPVVLDHLQEEIEPKIIEVAAKSIPLEIHFKSASSRIKLVQSHKSGELRDEVQRTSSNEEPQRLIHLVRKPIIQEVREIITPYRRIYQEIQPVSEQIITVVSHEKEGARTHGKLAHKQQSKTSTSSTTSQQQVIQTTTQKKAQSQHQQSTQSQSSQSSSSSNSQNTKIEQQKLPTSWLRPVHNQVEQKQISTSSSSGNGYSGREFTTYPLEVTSTRPPTGPELLPDESEQSEHGGSEVEDINDQSIEVVDGNDVSIIPARVMQEIIHEYQTRAQNNRVQEKLQQAQAQNQNQQNLQQRRPQQVQQPQSPTKGGPNSNFGPQQQQLRESASNRNWSAVRPYVYYGAQNGQYRGPFNYNVPRFNGGNRY